MKKFQCPNSTAYRLITLLAALVLGCVKSLAQDAGTAIPTKAENIRSAEIADLRKNGRAGSPVKTIDSELTEKINFVSNLSIHLLESGVLKLKWDGNGLGPVEIEKSENLLDWEQFIEIPGGDQRETTIDFPSQNGGGFYRVRALEASADFAPAVISGKTLTMTTEQSNVAETPFVDIYKLISDGRVLGADGSDTGISFDYQKISNLKGRIDYALVQDGVELEGRIDLTFTTEDGGDFELTQGEAVESGVFLIETP